MHDPTHHHHAHDHVHEQLEHPGKFEERQSPLTRDFTQRSFTVGVGGPVGTRGKAIGGTT